MEYLDGRFQLVLVDAEDIGLGIFGQHHGVAFEDAFERGDVIAVPGGLLVLQFGDRFGHLHFELLDEPGGFAPHERAQVLGEFAVLFLADPAHARCRTLVDIPQQAGTTRGLGAVEHPR